ncbi:hypothetical protein HK414_08055 [Ramlibacter terrae]|uniref:Uncharacterized protein n=1 Tax=Ramlibacter terrae TaxID=2732511 RepID=A0ABX6P1K4_9BURK|nr:hypothetical protein HK414_08055 [Ramlibacter terrae]
MPAPVIAEAPPQIKGNAALKGKRFYIAEYRVLFEVSGSATASTRAGYMPGMDFGATRMTVAYAVPKPNVDLFRAITDKAYADFPAKLDAAGLKPEPIDTFTRENGAVYEATVEGSKPGAEVYEDVDLGHGKRKYR